MCVSSKEVFPNPNVHPLDLWTEVLTIITSSALTCVIVYLGHRDSAPVCVHSIYLFLCSGVGWSSVNPVSAVDLQARVAEGEFWLDETEFLSQFDDVTVGYPISDEGHLRSIYTGNSLILIKYILNLQSLTLTSLAHFLTLTTLLCDRKSADTQPSAGWPVDERALRGWQPKQQQLRQQP